MALLKFNEWEKLDEGNIFSSVKDWLKSTFGSSMREIDDLIYQYKKSELEYVEEWQDILTEIDTLELKVAATDDAAEDKSLKRMIQRQEDLLKSIDNRHKKTTDMIFGKVQSLVKNDDKMENYWGNQKAEADVEVSKKMYEIAKTLSDESVQKNLYKKYKKAIENYENANKKILSKYKNLNKTQSKKSKAGVSKVDLDDLLDLSIDKFNEELKNFSSADAKEILKLATERRNSLYADMELEIKRNEKALERASSESVKRSIKERTNSAKKKYMEAIREYRTKITIAKKYV
jgi:hypothetical protein